MQEQLKDLMNLILNHRHSHLALVLRKNDVASKVLDIQQISDTRFRCDLNFDLYNAYEALLHPTERFIDTQLADNGELNLIASRQVAHIFLNNSNHLK